MITDEQRGDLLVRFLGEKGVQFRPGRVGWQPVSCYGFGHRHGDRNPSASVNLRHGHYKCHSCGLEGDAIGLVMEEKGLDFKGALVYLGVEQGQVEEIPEWI